MRRAISSVLLAGAMVAAGSPALAVEGDRDCPDFGSQREAQAAFDQKPGDPERLDRDGDGEACEEFFRGRNGGGASNNDNAASNNETRNEARPVLNVRLRTTGNCTGRSFGVEYGSPGSEFQLTALRDPDRDGVYTARIPFRESARQVVRVEAFRGQTADQLDDADIGRGRIVVAARNVRVRGETTVRATVRCARQRATSANDQQVTVKPRGGVETGGAPTQQDERWALGLGGVALLSAAGVATGLRRRRVGAALER